ncbi:MAG: C10 family peptidase [Saprospiraceae bacterium]|nr:C10 family peptidase [Saprospiraceae bacterium]
MELDEERPIFYLGTQKNNTRGHGWICDGYRVNSDNDYEFNMVWGWGGDGDGYFKLDAPVFFSWNSQYVDFKNQYMMINIEPITNPPTLVKATNGTSSDKVTISWAKSNHKFDGNYFQVYRSLQNDILKAEAISPRRRDIDSYEDKTGLPNKVYYYWVRSAKGIYYEPTKQTFGAINLSKPSNRDTGYRKGTKNSCDLINMTSAAGI